jgi:membrane fusion protein (multidrug efflux system)
VFEHVNRRGLAIGVAALVLVVVVLWIWLSPAPSGSVAAPAGRAREVRAASVIVHQPQLKPFAQEVSALGTVRANESVDVTSKVSDRVAAIHFREGQQVRKGDLLVELDNAEARADLAAAEAALAESRSQSKSFIRRARFPRHSSINSRPRCSRTSRGSRQRARASRID